MKDVLTNTEAPIRAAVRTLGILQAMKAAGWGRIALITSVSVKQPIPTLALSNTARTGLWAWAKTAATDLAPDGVTLEPLLHGCGQQDGRRSGTENTTGILAFARAFELLRDGDVVLVDRRAKIEVGDIVVAKHPVEQNSEVIKRVERINERGHCFLVGDNPEDSNDSRHFGAVVREYIKGKVVARLN